MSEKSYQPEYWRYELADGWCAYAGKSADDNDLLSTAFALPEDFWFHAHDHPGSHVILRAPAGERAPDPALLEQAAAIAAWHSKARQSPRCVVDCTMARNVSKPKGSPPGTVTITHVRRLKVKPALPTSSEI